MNIPITLFCKKTLPGTCLKGERYLVTFDGKYCTFPGDKGLEVVLLVEEDETSPIRSVDEMFHQFQEDQTDSYRRLLTLLTVMEFEEIDDIMTQTFEYFMFLGLTVKIRVNALTDALIEYSKGDNGELAKNTLAQDHSELALDEMRKFADMKGEEDEPA